MPHDSDESRLALRAQLADKVRDLADEACRNGGNIDADALANAQRLAQLWQLQRELTPIRKEPRWAVAALFAATVAIVSFLLLAHVRESEVEIDLVVTNLRFKVDSRQQLTDVLQLATLGASGLSHVALPGIEANDSASVSAVRLWADASGAAAGTISLEPIVAPAHSEITLGVGDVPGEFRLSISRLDAVLHADVNGTIHAAQPRSAQQTLNVATPQSIVLAPGSTDVNLDLAPQRADATLFAPGLTITDMTVMRIDEVHEGGDTVVRAASTILSGSVYLDELGGRELRLRANEGLRFAATFGEIRSIGRQGGGLALNFHGRVRGMVCGPLEHPRNLMPRWLDWLRANQPLSLLWGSALYLFGLSTAVRQWWKKND